MKKTFKMPQKTVWPWRQKPFLRMAHAPGRKHESPTEHPY